MKKSWILIILGLALVLRGAGLLHGLPYRYVPDTHVVRGALGMAQSKSLVPPPGTYTTYPYLLPYVLLPAYAGLYAAGRACGAWESAAEFGNRIVDDPTPLYVIARLMELAFGLLGVLLLLRIGRRVLGDRGGTIAGYLGATSFLLVHLAKSARPWVPLATLVLFAADRAIALARKGGAKRALVAGAAAGLAAACHQAGLLAVLLPMGALLGRVRRDGLARFVGHGALAALSFAGSALVVGYPYVLRGLDSDRGVSEAAERDADNVNFGGQGVAMDAFGVARAGETARALVCAEPVLLLLAIVGAARAFRRLRRERLAATLMLYPAAVLLIFLFYGGTHVRYMATAVPFVALLAAAGVEVMTRRVWSTLLAFALLLVPLVQACRLDLLLLREDTRTEFLRVVAEHVPEGETIALEGYGPPLRFSAANAEMPAHPLPWVSRAEAREMSGEAPHGADRPPYRVIPLERYYQFASVWPRQWWEWKAEGDPEKPVEEFLDEMGARFLVMVDRDPSGPRNSALDDVVARRGEKVAELAPWNGSAPAEARLPMDPDCAAMALWGVDRPGPRLTLWRLNGR